MSRKTRIFILIGASIGLVCLIACAVGYIFVYKAGQAVANSQLKSPEEVQTAANGIAQFTLPAGYSAREGMKILGITMAIFKSDKSDVYIMLMEMPTSEDLSEANTSQMQSAFQSQYGSGESQMQVVSTKDLTLRGKPAKLIISEGTAKGAAVRQVMVFFHGNNGLAALFITGPISQWDAKAFDKMVLSIR